MTIAQTLEVVYGLMNNVKVVMNGTLAWPVTDVQLKCYCLGNRRKSVNRQHPEGSGHAFTASSVLHELTAITDTMQQMASDINKMRRSL